MKDDLPALRLPTEDRHGELRSTRVPEDQSDHESSGCGGDNAVDNVVFAFLRRFDLAGRGDNLLGLGVNRASFGVNPASFGVNPASFGFTQLFQDRSGLCSNGSATANLEVVGAKDYRLTQLRDVALLGKHRRAATSYCDVSTLSTHEGRGRSPDFCSRE